MYPGQFYTREFLGLTKSKSKTRVYQGKVSINDLSSDRWVFFNGKLRMAFMNSMNEDLSRGAIIEKQLSQIKHDFPVDKELTEQIRLIGKEFRNIRGLSNKAELTEEEAIDIIESVFSATIGEGRFDNKIMLEVLTTPIKESPYGIEVYQQALDTLIDLRDLLFKESGFMPGQRFRDYYNKILRAINVLQRDIATSGGYSSPYLDFTTENSKSPISAIISAGKRIKGRFFENGTKKFVQKKIVTPIYGKNAVVVDTSVLQVPHINV